MRTEVYVVGAHTLDLFTDRCLIHQRMPEETPTGSGADFDPEWPFYAVEKTDEATAPIHRPDTRVPIWVVSRLQRLRLA
jgi:hypothetical protein